jgi:hypothetical protein
MTTVKEWSSAYANQADADFNTYQFLESLSDAFVIGWSIPNCHKLQFLQMACEKLVKAHLCAQGTSASSLQASHAFISKTLPVVIRQEMVAVNFRSKTANSLLNSAGHIAQEIELLAPSVRRAGQRPDNCEYPWEDAGGRIQVPLSWTFSSSQLIAQPAGRSVLKLIRSAIDRLMTQPARR